MVIKRKKLILQLTAFLLFCTTSFAHAASADFSWLASSTPIYGYKIHYGTSSRNYDAVIDLGLPETVEGRILASVAGLQEGKTYYFAATAYAAGGESGYSSEVVYTVPGPAGTADPSLSPDSGVTTSGADDFAFEAGELQVTSTWQHVEFSTEFIAPSVVAKTTTMNDAEPGLVSIRNVTSQGFDIRIDEWGNADGIHPEETVAFMAMDRGHHQIADTVSAVAECVPLSGLNSFQTVAFSNALGSQPVVVASIVTSNDPNSATLRTRDITALGFSITMQEQQDNDGSHAEETVCFIAMEKWAGVLDDLVVEVGSTENGLTDKAAAMSFARQFPTIPFVLSDMQGTNDIDTATLGIRDLSATDMTITVVEEQSADSEVAHAPEAAGYFAISPVNPAEGSQAPENADTAEQPAAPKQLNAQTMPSLISLFNDLINKSGR